ncbi:probable serine/threonine-protein kinase cdc7 [Contarinia nasturtii]|uniref:probable serine/threonine-protein kinase cdc7 n=1 Tax=Contarinia nasturtii TaxID=265458 RepID=UPI0012D3CCBF|nr:probable serine/threonine-protein kinase cdc7 [Contarinia nasturtii]
MNVFYFTLLLCAPFLMAVQAGIIPGVSDQQTLYPQLGIANQPQLGLTMGMNNQQPVYHQVVQQQPTGFGQQQTTYTTTVNGPNQVVAQQNHLIPSFLSPVTTVMHHIIQIPKTVQSYFNRSMHRQGSYNNNNNKNINRLSRNTNSRCPSGSRSSSNMVYNQEPVITHTSVPY